MIRKKTEKEFVIDLTGPEGNAYHLLAYAKSISRQLELDYLPIQEDMMSGDYEHLIEVFEKHFGNYVILER